MVIENAILLISVALVPLNPGVGYASVNTIGEEIYVRIWISNWLSGIIYVGNLGILNLLCMLHFWMCWSEHWLYPGTLIFREKISFSEFFLPKRLFYTFLRRFGLIPQMVLILIRFNGLLFMVYSLIKFIINQE